MKKMLDLIAANELAEVTEYRVEEVRKLARAGADFGLLGANTPHVVFEEVHDSFSCVPSRGKGFLHCGTRLEASRGAEWRL
jgi:aspartate/glutamate racemase